MAKWNLIIYAPAYNVEKSISELMSRINAVAKNLENSEILLRSVIIVNDGSIDSTRVILDDLKKKFSYLKIVNKEKNEGPVRALFDGMEASRQAIENLSLTPKKTIVVRMDSDLEHQPEDIPKLVSPIISGEAQISVGYIEFDHRSGSLAKLFNEFMGLRESREFLGFDIPQFCPGFNAVRGDAFCEIVPILNDRSAEFLRLYGTEMLAMDLVMLVIAKKLSKKIISFKLRPIEDRYIKKLPIEKSFHYFLHHSKISNFLRKSI